MSDFFKTMGVLHTLEKLGQQETDSIIRNNEMDKQRWALQDAQNAASLARAGAEYNERKIKELEQEVAQYKELLSKPMTEIAAENGKFRETYEKQQEMLASWITSQRAFREIAMQYGQSLGKKSEEVISEGMAEKEAVLLNKEGVHPKNNLSQDPFVSQYKDRLLAKIQQEKSGKQG